MTHSVFTREDCTNYKYTVADAIVYAKAFLQAQRRPLAAYIPSRLLTNLNEQITLEVLNNIQEEIIVDSYAYGGQFHY